MRHIDKIIDFLLNIESLVANLASITNGDTLLGVFGLSILLLSISFDGIKFYTILLSMIHTLYSVYTYRYSENKNRQIRDKIRFIFVLVYTVIQLEYSMNL